VVAIGLPPSDGCELAAARRKPWRIRTQPELAADIAILVRNGACQLRPGGLARCGSRDEQGVQPKGCHDGKQ